MHQQTPLTDKHLKDSEDWVVRETRGSGIHVAAARSIERNLRECLLDVLEAEFVRPSCQSGSVQRCRCYSCSKDRAIAALGN